MSCRWTIRRECCAACTVASTCCRCRGVKSAVCTAHLWCLDRVAVYLRP